MTLVNLNSLIRLTSAQIKPAAQMLSRAFQEDALYVYLVPGAADRERILPYLFQFRLRYGLRYGEAYATSTGLEGIAIWFPSKNAHMTRWMLLRSGGLELFSKAGKEVIARISSFGDYASVLHQRHAPFPHWYLSPIGVDPAQQGKGYARLLLMGMLTRLDEEKLPCYLETQSEKNVAIYRHFGFEVVEESKIPGTTLTHWSMLRNNR